MKRLGFGLGFVCLMAVAAFAQQKVDQGRPGNQGPWPVTCTNCSSTVIIDGGLTSAVYFDGGYIGQTADYQCSNDSAFKNNIVGSTAVAMPIDGGLPGRLYVRVCNSLQNSGNPLVKCLFGPGLTPVMAVGNPGDVIGTGDCVTYPARSDAGVTCIADTATTYVPSFECK